MAPRALLDTEATTDGGYRVRLPRPCDAMGGMLRQTYPEDASLPDDMRKLLRRLNARPATTRDH